MSSNTFKGNKSYFPNIGAIRYEGPDSDNPLAFQVYDENKIVGNKTMREHLRFSVAYWHTFCGRGGDPFGPGTLNHPWDERSDPMDAAKDRLDAAFEFFSKLGVPYYCFHDRDMSPEGSSPADSEKKLIVLSELARERQMATGIRLLWGTANVFSHPRYMNGAATNPDFQVLAHAGAQVKAALDATQRLGGENYVFWGGREGYNTLLNTDMKRELEHMGMFLTKARDYGRSIGFKGTFLIEPKPMEPTKHQYDSDAATVIGFLRQYDLERDFKLNIEANHATLAGHDFAHDLQMAADADMLGSIDANRGDPLNGWDTDQFPTDLYDTCTAMLVVLGQGGLGKGGLNFDAKVRRNSTDLEDIFIAHIGGMDAFARGLEVAHALQGSLLSELKKTRYESFEGHAGRMFEDGCLGLTDLAALAEKMGEPAKISGRQEMLENLLNRYLLRSGRR